jgi:hypothetical protein
MAALSLLGQAPSSSGGSGTSGAARQGGAAGRASSSNTLLGSVLGGVLGMVGGAGRSSGGAAGGVDLGKVLAGAALTLPLLPLAPLFMISAAVQAGSSGMGSGRPADNGSRNSM